jgi:SAM-dependent methyltransferase
MTKTSGPVHGGQRRLRAQQRDWNDLASVDALWAVLTDADRQHGHWRIDEFFATGEKEIGGVMTIARSLELPRRNERALDFGCGVGRLTRALSHRFTTCVGVDIAPAMLANARRLNVNFPSCEFVLNTSNNLGTFASHTFDFVYSSKVLQHMNSRSVALAYIGEFLRLLRDDGLAVFQVPYEVPFRRRVQPRRRLYRPLRAAGFSERWLYKRAALNPMKTISVPQDEVTRAVENAGGVVLTAVPAVDEPNPSFFYYARRR